MPTLQEILDKTQKGQAIVEMANEFNFEEVKLYKGLAKDVLCLVVNRKSINNNQVANRTLFQNKIAESFNLKVIVLEEEDGLISADNKAHIAENSITLPLKTRLEELNILGIFGNPHTLKIKSLNEELEKGRSVNKIV